MCSTMLLLVFANAAYAGKYVRAKDRKTMVWDNNPKHGEAVSWSGDRDDDGYATGKGTVTWYKVERKGLTGFHIPSANYIPIVAYSGKMVRGKLTGSVETVENGKKFHAKFTDGRKVGRWAEGPAPRSGQAAVAEQRPEEPVVRRAELVEPPPPAAGPSIVAEASPPKSDSTPAEAKEPVKQEVAKPAPVETANEKPQPAATGKENRSEYDDSLRALLGPPPTLQTRTVAKSSPQASVAPATSAESARPRLTQAEVINLADAEARTQGYDLGDYQRPQSRYISADGTWSVVYEHKSVDPNGETGKPFSVSVEDKTKKASVAAK